MDPRAEQAACVAQRMLRAAKTKDPVVLANAAMWIIELACMCKDPDKWIEFANKRAKGAAK